MPKRIKKVSKLDSRWLIGGVLVVLLAFVFIRPVVAQTSFANLIARFAGERLGDRLVEQVNLDEDMTFAGFPGPDVFSDFVSFNGVTHHYRKVAFDTSTTSNSVVCSIKRPGTASSSVVAVGVRIDGLSTSTGALAIYKGANMNSTTTIIAGPETITATGTTVVATTTLATNASTLGAGDEWIVFDYRGARIPYQAMGGQTGECSLETIEY